MIKKLSIFTGGVVIGAVATYILVKDRFDKKTEEEIESVREYYKQKLQSTRKEDKKDIPKPEEKTKKKEQDFMEYAKMVDESGYTNYSDISTTPKEEEKKEEHVDVEKPYVISPDEFGEFDDYETISLTFYADKVLTDSEDCPVDDIDEIVGLESLEHFGEYEDDSVFVRNDMRKSDYEILADSRRYADIVTQGYRYPHDVEA